MNVLSWALGNGLRLALRRGRGMHLCVIPKPENREVFVTITTQGASLLRAWETLPSNSDYLETEAGQRQVKREVACVVPDHPADHPRDQVSWFSSSDERHQRTTGKRMDKPVKTFDLPVKRFAAISGPESQRRRLSGVLPAMWQ